MSHESRWNGSGDQLNIKTSLCQCISAEDCPIDVGHLNDLQGLHGHRVRPNFGRANHPMLIISYVISICIKLKW